MKKITALGLASLLGLSAVAAAPQVATKLSRHDAEKTAHEALGKKVKGMPTIRNKQMKESGLELQRSIKRLRVNALPGSRKAPAKISAESKNLYGFLSYYEGDYENYERLGYCSINPESGEFTNVVPLEFTATAVGEKDGKLYVNCYESFWGYIMGAYNIVYDLESGDPIEYEEIDIDSDFNHLFVAAGFDAEAGVFYGTTFSDDDTRHFTTYDVDTKEYAYYDDTVSSEAYAYNQETGDVVGIKTYSDGSTYLLKYDKATGEATPITEVAYTTDYPGGLCYSPEDGGYIWNPNSDDWSQLVLVTESGAVTEICDLEGYAEFTVLVNTDSSKADPNAPCKPEIESIDFAGADLSGKIVVTMPSQLEGGDAISGEVSYTLYCDKEEMMSGSAAAGATVTLDVTVGQGMHSFSVACAVGDVVGREASKSAYVGNDTPCAPKDVKLDAANVSWEAVTEGIHGGYVEAAAVTYTVSLNGEVIAKDITETSCPTGLPESVELDLYVASVVASCNELTSAAGYSNDLVYGDPLTMPVSIKPTEKESKLFTIIDTNEDGSKWSYYIGGSLEESFRYNYNGNNDGDDWLILPAIEFESADVLYSFEMMTCSQSTNYIESLEVCIGKAPAADAMTKTIIEPTDIDFTAPQPMDAYFNIDEPGTYYIGVHAISAADAYYLYAADFKVENTGILASGPAAAADIMTAAAPQGELKATVTATLPTKSIDGADLADGVKVTLKVSSEVGEASVEGNAGETVSVDVATVQGNNRLRVQTAVGEALGMIEYVTVFTGVEAPGALTNMKAVSSADNLSAKVTWEAPTVGINGGYVDPAGITYYTCQNTIFGWQLYEELGTDVYEYEISVPAGSPQANQTVAIVGINESGAGLISSVSIPLGQLYELPVKETFTNNRLTYSPVTISGGNSMEWNLGNPGVLFGEEFANESGNAVYGIGFEAETASIAFPRFNAAGTERMALDFSIYCGDIEDVILKVSGYDVEPQEAFRLSATEHGDGYQNFSVLLPEAVQDIPWASFEFETVLGTYGGTFILESYRLRELIDNDLAVASLAAPSSTSIGAAIDVIANIENQGLNASDYKGGTFFLVGPNGTVIDAKAIEADKTLQPGETVQASAQFDIIAECLGNCSLRFVLSSFDDNQANNEMSAALTVTRGQAVVVTDLEGAWNEEGSAIDLSWTAAEYNPGFESFENNTPFVISSDMIGEFINVDRDGKDTYCWSGAANIPELDDMAFKAGAFNVINADVLNEYFDGGIEAPDGEQCLLAFCPADGSAADDWLISPEVVAGSKFSFFAEPLTLEYGPEEIEICYSTGSVDPDDFKVLEAVTVDVDQWTEYEFQLPEDAVRFAIHYISEDIFGLKIDAISYLPKDADAITGYDVYRAEIGKDAEKIGHTEDCSYTDATVDGSVSYSYYVVPTLASGADGEKSNVVIIGGTTGIDNLKAVRSIVAGRGEIVLKGYAGQNICISNVAGQAITHDAASDIDRVSVPAGVYLVKTSDRVVKIIVK